MDYSRTFGSNYPSSCIPYGNHKDVDNTVINIINMYNSYLQNGDMVSAGNYLAQHKAKLEPYMITMSDINRLEEEIYNTGLYALSSNNTIISGSEPEVEQNMGNYWFQDYE